MKNDSKDSTIMILIIEYKYQSLFLRKVFSLSNHIDSFVYLVIRLISKPKNLQKYIDGTKRFL